MKIVIKESDKLTSKLHSGKSISEYLVYLVDDNNTPLSCDVSYGIDDKNKRVNSLLVEHFVTADSDSREAFTANLNNIIEEVAFSDFKTQK